MDVTDALACWIVTAAFTAPVWGAMAMFHLVEWLSRRDARRRTS